MKIKKIVYLNSGIDLYFENIGTPVSLTIGCKAKITTKGLHLRGTIDKICVVDICTGTDDGIAVSMELSSVDGSISFNDISSIEIVV